MSPADGFQTIFLLRGSQTVAVILSWAIESSVLLQVVSSADKSAVGLSACGTAEAAEGTATLDSALPAAFPAEDPAEDPAAGVAVDFFMLDSRRATGTAMLEDDAQI
jgi:hypothetical protein